MPGQLYYEDLDAATYAEWGVDYLKSDNCASYALDPSVRFGAMRDALNRTGRPIVLSIEPFSVRPDVEQGPKVSNLWRIGVDIESNYLDILNRADISDKWAPLAGPGGWNGKIRCARSVAHDEKDRRRNFGCLAWLAGYRCGAPQSGLVVHA